MIEISASLAKIYLFIYFHRHSATLSHNLSRLPCLARRRHVVDMLSTPYPQCYYAVCFLRKLAEGKPCNNTQRSAQESAIMLQLEKFTRSIIFFHIPQFQNCIKCFDRYVTVIWNLLSLLTWLQGFITLDVLYGEEMLFVMLMRLLSA